MTGAVRVVHVDTSEVRVCEWRLAPGSSTRRRRHSCDVVIVPITQGRLRIVGDAGEKTVDVTPGAAVLYSAPMNQEAFNDSDAAVAFIEIQLKDSVRRLISG